MINGAHVILYSPDAEADREFIRDVLGFPHVDAGHGWLLFRLPPAEVAVHPAGDETGAGPRHELYLMCDDIEATLAGLAARGATVAPELSRQRWGIIATITLPSGAPLSLYQPLHPIAHSLTS
jgi:catechol 2,3-dioxygenase-like lactoylglutathione lyase family enzyme